MVKNPPTMHEIQEIRVWSWVRKIPWRRKWQPTPVVLPRNSHGQRTESREELKSLLMRVKEESERAGLKLSIKKRTKIMASCPITSWQIEGKRWK